MEGLESALLLTPTIGLFLFVFVIGMLLVLLKGKR